MTRATRVEAGQRCDGCDGCSTDCRARLGPCCPDCTCAPPPGPPPHRYCSGCPHGGASWDSLPCPFCPCAACRRFAREDELWTVAELVEWQETVDAGETVIVVQAHRCGHRWLETSSRAYRRNGDHCKVCGLRRTGMSWGLATPLPSDRFVFDRDDGLGPMF